MVSCVVPTTRAAFSATATACIAIAAVCGVVTYAEWKVSLHSAAVCCARPYVNVGNAKARLRFRRARRTICGTASQQGLHRGGHRRRRVASRRARRGDSLLWNVACAGATDANAFATNECALQSWRFDCWFRSRRGCDWRRSRGHRSNCGGWPRSSMLLTDVLVATHNGRDSEHCEKELGNRLESQRHERKTTHLRGSRGGATRAATDSESQASTTNTRLDGLSRRWRMQESLYTPTFAIQ